MNITQILAKYIHMTYLRTEEYSHIGGNNRKYIKKTLYFQCDECQKEFVAAYHLRFRFKELKHHFCSRVCSNKAACSGVIKEEREKTTLERYGNKAFVATDKFKEVFTKNCLEKYGVKSHLEVPEILEKIKQTCKEKYGRETFAGSEQHKQSLDYQDIVKKAWKTKLSNKTTKNISSKQEERVNLILINFFNSKNIIRGKRLIKQFIDFYIKSMNLFIQIDGVYWHGLNRSFEEIGKQKTRQDVKILKQIERDKKLNLYCEQNQLKLLRITDEEVDSLTDNEILEKIIKFGGKN